MANRYVVDIETDNLLMDATKIHCIVLKDIDTGKIYKFVPFEVDNALPYLEDAELLILHNGIGFDLPILKKFIGFDYDVNKVFDTAIVSRILLPDREGGHSLDAWGKRTGTYKQGYTGGFEDFSQEMLEYCIQDVEATEAVFNYLKGDAREVWDSIIMENKFAYYISLQILNGFTLDIDKATKLYQELLEEYESIHNTMMQILPERKVLTHYRDVKKKGLLLEETDTTYTYITAKTKKITVKEFKFDIPNPTSRQQIIDFFKEKYNWVPKQYTDKGTPEINEKVLESLNYQEAKLLSRLFRLQKQMSMIKSSNKASKGWLDYVRGDRVHGDLITIGANTHRCTHSKPNMAQVDKKDLRMREVWIPRKDWKLVGCDASGLELRILGHYLAPYDNGRFAYQASAKKEDIDLHEENRKAAGLDYRDSAKTMIYALIYGAGNGKLGTVFAADKHISNMSEHDKLKAGSVLRQNLFDNLMGYERLLEDVSEAFRVRNKLKAIDGRWLYPRKDYSALNLLIQSAGALVMKQALINFMEGSKLEGYIHGKDFALVANVHDEIQFECSANIADILGKLCVESIRKVSKDLKLKVDLDGEYMVGNNWRETH